MFDIRDVVGSMDFMVGPTRFAYGNLQRSGKLAITLRFLGWAYLPDTISASGMSRLIFECEIA